MMLMLRRTAIILLGGAAISCRTPSEGASASSARVASASPSAAQPEASALQIIFRSKQGETITDADLQNVSGKVDWELRGGKPVAADAVALHERGRQAGAAGRNDEALRLFADAARAAPDWPYPPYDAAFTCLLTHDDAGALKFYKQALQLSPRGFFTAITAVHYLEQEAAQKIPRGTYLAFLSLEWMKSADERARYVEALTEHVPSFAPAWKELASLREDPDQRLATLESGLKQNPDAETRGFLLLNKALLLDRMARHDEAVDILGTLATEASEPLDVGQLARLSLAQIVLKK